MVKVLSGKEAALKKLEDRRAKNRNRKPIRNESLPAGSDMHFPCKTCNADIAVYEDYLPPRPKNCVDCQELIDNGWL